MHTRALVRLIAALAVLPLISGCGPTATSVATQPPTTAALAAEDVAQLHLPGSAELSAGGQEAEWTLEGGPLAAVVWRRYGVDAAWEDVASYFAEELAARGWREGGCASGQPSTRESDVAAWHTDDRILRVGNREDPPKDVGMIRTYYEVALLGKGVARVCADRDRSPAPQVSPSE